MVDTTLFENFIRADINTKYRDRAPTEQELLASANFVRMMCPELTDDDIDHVLKKLETALDVAMDTGIVLSKDFTPWFMARKNKIDFFYWNRYVRYLAEDQHRPPQIISTIDKVTDKIVDLIGDPTADDLHRRGLIIGDVQSGKTANYIGIMNKAADAGYRVIILLTGTIESLRRQTQERVDEGFIGRSSKAYLRKNGQTIKRGVGLKDASRFATGFTTEASDFKVSTMQSMNATLPNMCSEPVVFVLKKNARTLQNLIAWLDSNPKKNGYINFPLLLIDDEADNASINTRADDDPTTINKSIRQILDLFSHWSYVGVTATPFANIFILPERTEAMETEDLFPSDYIYSLDAPTNYIGSNELFGDNASYEQNIIRIEDANKFFPYKHKADIQINGLPESLQEAMRYFVLANAVRDIKGDIASHRSMLVNVSRFTKVQERISELVVDWMFELTQDIKNYCMLNEDEACQNDNMFKLRETWNNTQNPFLADLGVSWETIQKKYLLSAITPIEVRTVNQRSSEKLDYTIYNETGLRVIAIGGLSLSRGLTLEGLMVSYFHRNSQMYDTLMQMGRWFGYRSGYEKLFRIWMPDDAIGWYAHITQATNELREDIATMNRIGALPRDFGLRVRAHPTSLAITARNKMKHTDRIERWITLDGKFFETPRFIADTNIIRANKERADALLTKIFSTCGEPTASRNQPLFWNDVPRELICDFLRKYENHPLNVEADGATLCDYITKNTNFAKWDVLVPTSRLPMSHEICGYSIHPFSRPLSKISGVLSSYNSKMRIGTMGLTKHGLSQRECEDAERVFRDSKRDSYEKKYKDKAEEKLESMSVPDRAYLIQGRNPILIVHYLKPTEDSDMPQNFDFDKDLAVGYALGFPQLAGSEPVYAVYYINMVEQQKYLVDELEEDQLDDIDGKT